MGVHLGPRDAKIPSSSLFEALSLVGEKDRDDHNTAGGIREGGSSGVGEALRDCLRETGRLPTGGGTGS